MPNDRYTHGHHESVLASHRKRTADNSAAYLLPHLNRGGRVLDVGCGPGTISADFASLVAPGQVVAMDRSWAVVEEAAEIAKRRGLTNVTTEIGDVYAIDFPDQSFDIVHAHQLLQHLSDPLSALREMRRVTRSDGFVAVRDADYSAMTWYPPDPRLDRWIEIYISVARSNHAEPDAGRHLLAWVNQAGFTDVEPSASVWCFADPASRLWWSELWSRRMTVSSVAQQALDGDHATRSDLAAIAAGFRDWASDRDAWFTVLHGEVLAKP